MGITFGVMNSCKRHSWKTQEKSNIPCPKLIVWPLASTEPFTERVFVKERWGVAVLFRLPHNKGLFDLQN